VLLVAACSSSDDTAAVTTTVAPDTTVPPLPEQIWGGQGETVWAVYFGYWPESEFTPEAYDNAVSLGRALGYDFYGGFDLRCDQGAYELLGLDPTVNYVGAAVYFATESEASVIGDFETRLLRRLTGHRTRRVAVLIGTISEAPIGSSGQAHTLCTPISDR